jgi:hypothetical protein
MPPLTLEDCQARLRSRREPALLVPPGIWDESIDLALERLLPDTSLLKGALHLWNDNLTRAHEIAQEIATQTASYLHGVMHRREPDYGNSKYWFRKVGNHPNFPSVRKAAIELVPDSLRDRREEMERSPRWDPFRMVDWCEEAEGKTDPVARFLCFLQAREIELLVGAC